MTNHNQTILYYYDKHRLEWNKFSYLFTPLRKVQRFKNFSVIEKCFLFYLIQNQNQFIVCLLFVLCFVCVLRDPFNVTVWTWWSAAASRFPRIGWTPSNPFRQRRRLFRLAPARPAAEDRGRRLCRSWTRPSNAWRCWKNCPSTSHT